MALNLTSEGLKYPPEVQVQHETCSTICGTPVQAILDQKNLTGLAGGVREGPNIAKYGPRFWLLSPLEAPKWVQDPGNGLKSIRGSWGDHLGSIFQAILQFIVIRNDANPSYDGITSFSF